MGDWRAIKGDSFNALTPAGLFGKLTSAFQRSPDLVAGGAANTTAAIDLVTKLTGLPAMNLLSRASHKPLTNQLLQKLNVD